MKNEVFTDSLVSCGQPFKGHFIFIPVLLKATPSQTLGLRACTCSTISLRAKPRNPRDDSMSEN